MINLSVIRVHTFYLRVHLSWTSVFTPTTVSEGPLDSRQRHYKRPSDVFWFVKNVYSTLRQKLLENESIRTLDFFSPGISTKYIFMFLQGSLLTHQMLWRWREWQDRKCSGFTASFSSHLVQPLNVDNTCAFSLTLAFFFCIFLSPPLYDNFSHFLSLFLSVSFIALISFFIFPHPFFQLYLSFFIMSPIMFWSLWSDVLLFSHPSSLFFIFQNILNQVLLFRDVTYCHHIKLFFNNIHAI